MSGSKYIQICLFCIVSLGHKYVEAIQPFIRASNRLVVFLFLLGRRECLKYVWKTNANIASPLRQQFQESTSMSRKEKSVSNINFSGPAISSQVNTLF